MKKISLLCALITVLLAVGCQNKPASDRAVTVTVVNKDSAAINKAKQLYDEGRKILTERITADAYDTVKAMKLDRKAVELFTAANESDPAFKDPVLMASECTMYEKDYKNCLSWTTKLMQLDTSKQNVDFCRDRIAYCNKKMSDYP